MKRTLYIFAVLVLSLALFPAMASAATQADPYVVDLIAGQNTDVGDIKIWDDTQYLYVQYETISPYCLMETQLHVADSLDGIPQKNGNPAPGQFDYKRTHNCATRVLYKVPLPQTEACDLYVATHAAINTGETAWGAGPAFPGKNWATYILYRQESCNVIPPECEPQVFAADFTNIPNGASIEGMGTLLPNLDIDAKGTAVKISKGQLPDIYKSRNGTINGNLSPKGGFSDQETRDAKQAHLYTFTFAPGTSVSNFSLHMLDYGDLNTQKSSAHLVTLTAYDANNNVVTSQQLSYTTPAVMIPKSSDLYGDMSIAGDASARLGKPGNWLWNISGSGMVKLVLEFGAGYDPHIAFDRVRYVIGCEVCEPLTVKPDLSQIPNSNSVEGMGTVAPYLEIDAKGNALKISEGQLPEIYKSRNGTINGELDPTGGFSDKLTRDAKEAHLYTFTFAPGMSVSSFSLHMLDYGDLNTPKSSAHLVTLTAYDVNDNVVTSQQLSYTTPAVMIPKSSDLYGDMSISGDASAAPGSPGNWIWNVSGGGIVKLVLEFGAGYDPHIALDVLSYTIECAP